MNLKEKFQNLPAERSYEEITGDAEKYLFGAISAMAGKKPEDIEGDLSLHGTGDGSHFHIVVDGESKVVVNSDNKGHVQITLDETDETVELNEKDAAELNELLISKVKDHAREHMKNCPLKGIMDLIARFYAIPAAIHKLRKEGKDPNKMTPEEIFNYVDQMMEE